MAGNKSALSGIRRVLICSCEQDRAFLTELLKDIKGRIVVYNMDFLLNGLLRWQFDWNSEEEVVWIREVADELASSQSQVFSQEVDDKRIIVHDRYKN